MSANPIRPQHLLLLQGPMGPFFRYLADALEGAGHTVTKVNFNGGDGFYFHDARAVDYRGSLADWQGWIRERLTRQRPDGVFLFGDRRPYHRVAIEQAHALGIDVFVFEEGYLRPNFVTLERDGVNARSGCSGDRELHRYYAALPSPEVKPVGHVFWHATFYIAAYTWASYLEQARYPHFVSHRPLHPVREGARWIGGGVRKLRWWVRDRGKLERFSGELSGRYFLVPLQVHDDYQIRESPSFDCVETFIRHVVCEFVVHARRDHHLVLKHHPMDRAYRNYQRLVRDLAHDTGLDGRLHYVADLHLPTLLRHARGTIVINSTAGLQSLHHGTPTLATDVTLYSRAGLSYVGEVGDFLRDPGVVDQDAVAAFVAYLRHTTQLNGSFYKRAALPPLQEIPIRYLGAPSDAASPPPALPGSALEPA